VVSEETKMGTGEWINGLVLEFKIINGVKRKEVDRGAL